MIANNQPEREKILIVLILVLLPVSLLLNLGIFPLYNEEPRRALIALEMLFNGNLIVPTQMGEFYYKKPPVFNWVLIGAFKLFGSYSEFAVRFVSVISLLGMGILNYLFLKKYASKTLALFASLLFIISADIYFYFALTSEIDLFYSLITFASILTIYHYHRQGKLWHLFLITYTLGAIGFLTKGLPSLVFLAVSVGIFFIYKKQFLKLFSIQHIAGILLFFLITGGYFYIYSSFNSLDGFVRDLWSQSSDRTVIRMSFARLLQHIFVFPMVMLKDILPASLFILLLNRSISKKVWQNDVVKFCLVMFTANILVYWISPGTRSRYIYMLYPFLINVLTFVYLQRVEEQQWFKKILHVLILLLGGILLIGSISAPFIPALDAVNSAYLWSIIFVLGAGVMLFFYIKKGQNKLLWLILVVIVGRLWFDVFVLPARAAEGEHVTFKKDAENIYAITKDEELYLFNEKTDGNYSLGNVFYLERQREEVLSITTEKNCEDFFITHIQDVQDQQIEVYYEFGFRGMNYYLFKFTDCN